VPGKTIDEHIKSVAKAFTKALKGMPALFVDGFYIELEDELENGSSPVDAIFNALRSASVPFIPTIGLDPCGRLCGFSQGRHRTDKRGCCLRLVESDLESLSGIRGTN